MVLPARTSGGRWAVAESNRGTNLRPSVPGTPVNFSPAAVAGLSFAGSRWLWQRRRADRHRCGDVAQYGAQLTVWSADHEKADCAWDYRWCRVVDCGSVLTSMAAHTLLVGKQGP